VNEIRLLSRFFSAATRRGWHSGWRQFMWWFADIESRITDGTANVRNLLRDAEERWLALENADVLMEEARNNGSWIRPWRRALAEYSAF
jgi:hypothetical protein